MHLIGRGHVGAGRVYQVVSGHAACATVPRPHVGWLGEPPPRRSDRVSPGGESVLREHLGPRQLRLTDAQRRRLAVRGQKLGRRVLTQVAGIVTPDTILRWYRRLIAKKYDGSACRGRGRPKTRREVAVLVVRMAVDNPQWGYTRIRGALSNLGHNIARTTVKRILHDHGIDPAPERSRRLPWKTFLQAHWEGLAACDLFTVEVLTLAGLRRYLVFFVIELKSPSRDHRRDPPAAGRRVDGAAGPQLDRPGRWLSAQGPLSDSRPRPPLYTGLQRDPGEQAVSSRFGSRRRVPISTPMPNGSSDQSKRSVLRASSRSARGIYVVSSASTSSTTIARETIRDSTTSSCNDRHRRFAWTLTFGDVSVSVDCSISTIGRPHEWSAD